MQETRHSARFTSFVQASEEDYANIATTHSNQAGGSSPYQVNVLGWIEGGSDPANEQTCHPTKDRHVHSEDHLEEGVTENTDQYGRNQIKKHGTRAQASEQSR